MANCRNLDIPLQNNGVATFPVPMTPADHALLTTILEGLKAIHVREVSTENNSCVAEQANEAESRMYCGETR